VQGAAARDNGGLMAAEIDKPSLLQRIVPLFRGFDFRC
jgi:hypothetical protein